LAKDQKDQPGYWFNLANRKVEFGLKTNALNRIGPFETAAEAEQALEIIESRSKAWRDEEDSDRN
jgi:hypothetical protein